MIEPITMRRPGTIEFGRGRSDTIGRYLAGSTRIVVVCDEAVRPHIDDLARTIEAVAGSAVKWITGVVPEPPIAEVERLRAIVDEFAPDSIVGIGGGSAIDTAKMLAVLHRSPQRVEELTGTNVVAGRSTRLIAVPTTAGTGSEVTPIAVLTDTEAHLKKGVVSDFLIPDVAIVDPRLTVSAPPAVTASTGLDALTHCIEAYTNVHHHPAVDLYALEGVRLISANVRAAVDDGSNLEARTAMSLGSLYGGLCLGPVNTAAVHAMAYPLGGTFKVAHGVANSALLPYVMEFNMPACEARYAQVGRAMGIESGSNANDGAAATVAHVRELSRGCGIPVSLKTFGVGEGDLDAMAEAAVQVTRLMSNNPRPVSVADAREIYRRALVGKE